MTRYLENDRTDKYLRCKGNRDTVGPKIRPAKDALPAKFTGLPSYLGEWQDQQILNPL